MSYGFPKILPKNGCAKSYIKDITVLTRRDKNDAKSGFCGLLQGLRAIDFDEVKDDLCEDVFVEPTKSVDCFFAAKKGLYYFIEFKNSTKESLDGLGKVQITNPKTHKLTWVPVIEYSLRKKGFDSISIAAKTVLQGVPAKTIMDNAVYIVVRRNRDVGSVLEFLNDLTSVSGGIVGSAKGSSPVLWNLDKLKVLGFFKEVYTWTENEFVAQARQLLA